MYTRKALVSETLFAEASCSGVIRTARNVVKDLGTQAGSVGGLAALASCSLVHPDRDAQKLLGEKMGLSLPVPFTTLSVPESSANAKMGKFERLSLKDWCRFILDSNSWHHLCGLLQPHPEREKAIWSSFWSKYRQIDGEHQIFKLAVAGHVNLSRAAAVCLHGDEGRGRRRQAFMVLSFFSCLGRGTVLSTSSSRLGKKVKKSFLKMKLNFRGHTYTTRMLSGVLPRHMYEKNEACLDALLDAAYEDARFMAFEGLKDRYGETHWMVVLGTTGDWPFLHKAGKLERTYANVVKRLNQTAGGVCHLCDAGPPHTPWEQIGTRRPDWLQTQYVTSPFWMLPGAARVPHTPHCLQAHYKFDLFHCWHLGVGRNFCGAILALLSDLESGNIEQRFQNLTEKYKAWCARTHHTPLLSRLTKDTIQWGSTTEYPSGGWFKVGITTVIMEFFKAYDFQDGPDEPLLLLALEAARSINAFFRLLYSQDVWLAPQTSVHAGQLLSKFLRRYGRCAEVAFQQGRALFALQPKLHALHHVAIDLLQVGEQGKDMLSPMTFSCQQSEDFVGRPSRLSRRVTAMQRDGPSRHRALPAGGLHAMGACRLAGGD